MKLAKAKLIDYIVMNIWSILLSKRKVELVIYALMKDFSD